MKKQSMLIIEKPDNGDAALIRKNEGVARRLQNVGYDARTKDSDNGHSFRYICVHPPKGKSIGVWATAEECRQLLNYTGSEANQYAFDLWAKNVTPMESILQEGAELHPVTSPGHTGWGRLPIAE